MVHFIVGGSHVPRLSCLRLFSGVFLALSTDMHRFVHRLSPEPLPQAGFGACVLSRESAKDDNHPLQPFASELAAVLRHLCGHRVLPLHVVHLEHSRFHERHEMTTWHAAGRYDHVAKHVKKALETSFPGIVVLVNHMAPAVTMGSHAVGRQDLSSQSRADASWQRSHEHAVDELVDEVRDRRKPPFATGKRSQSNTQRPQQFRNAQRSTSPDFRQSHTWTVQDVKGRLWAGPRLGSFEVVLEPCGDAARAVVFSKLSSGTFPSPKLLSTTVQHLLLPAPVLLLETPAIVALRLVDAQDTAVVVKPGKVTLVQIVTNPQQLPHSIEALDGEEEVDEGDESSSADSDHTPHFQKCSGSSPCAQNGPKHAERNYETAQRCHTMDRSRSVWSGLPRPKCHLSDERRQQRLQAKRRQVSQVCSVMKPSRVFLLVCFVSSLLFSPPPPQSLLPIFQSSHFLDATPPTQFCGERGLLILCRLPLGRLGGGVRRHLKWEPVL